MVQLLFLVGLSPFSTIQSDYLIRFRKGVMISQYLIGEVHEQSVFNALLLIEAFLAVAIQLVNIGSAAIFFLAALPLFVALALNPLFAGSNTRLSLWTYGLGSILPSLTGTLLLLGVVEVFVPLVNDIPFVTRTGADFYSGKLDWSYWWRSPGRQYCSNNHRITWWIVLSSYSAVYPQVWSTCAA